MSVVISTHARTDTGYSIIREGVIETASRRVPFEDEEPYEAQDAMPYILETGLTGGLKSLRLPMHEIARLGHRAIILGHTHRDIQRPIHANAVDVELVAEELTSERVHLVGLSRGFADDVLAARHLGDKVLSISGVSPAMLIKARLLSPKLVVEGLIQGRRDPKGFKHLVADCIRTTITRPEVTISEAMHLLSGSIHHIIREIKGRPDAPYMQVIATRHDGFFEPHIMEQAAHFLGLDSFVVHDSGTAGHAAFAYDSTMARSLVNNLENKIDKKA